MKNLTLYKKENRAKVEFYKRMNQNTVIVINEPRYLELDMKQAKKLHDWLSRAIEEAERKVPHQFKIGDKVRVRQIITHINIRGEAKITRKWINGTIVSKEELYKNSVPLTNKKTYYERHDRRVYVKFDKLDNFICPLCMAKRGGRRGMRVNPHYLEIRNG